MPFRDLGFNITYYYFINSLVCVSQNLFCLIDDAKVQRLLPDSKNLGEIFPELLRQGGIGATKGVREPKYCRFPAEPPQGGVHQGLTAENENAADMVNLAISVANRLFHLICPMPRS